MSPRLADALLAYPVGSRVKWGKTADVWGTVEGIRIGASDVIWIDVVWDGLGAGVFGMTPETIGAP